MKNSELYLVLSAVWLAPPDQSVSVVIGGLILGGLALYYTYKGE